MINSHNCWGKLEEVWLGDVYPMSWYDHLDSEVRDCFHEITEKTQQDLALVVAKLDEFGVVVRRPVYDNIDDYIQVAPGASDAHLVKPEITPRDNYITINNTLFAKKANGGVSPWQHAIDDYEQSGGDVRNQFRPRGYANISGASIVRAGKDLYIDAELSSSAPTKATYLHALALQTYMQELFPENRIHILNNGGHLDSCFALLKPGLILASHYFDSYEKTFPNWKRIQTISPEFFHHREESPAGRAGKRWWLPDRQEFQPGRTSHAFNSHIIKHAQTWIGNYTETFFEVNSLVLDEKNVMVPGEHDAIFRRLEEYGITAHPMPIRTRTFWDGGMHCMTLDIRRQTTLEDCFPERGDGPGMMLLDPHTT